MSDTITKTCRVCEEDFDSIPEIDKGVCDVCKEQQSKEDMNYELLAEKYFD